MSSNKRYLYDGTCYFELISPDGVNFGKKLLWDNEANRYEDSGWTLRSASGDNDSLKSEYSINLPPNKYS